MLHNNSMLPILNSALSLPMISSLLFCSSKFDPTDLICRIFHGLCSALPVLVFVSMDQLDNIIHPMETSQSIIEVIEVNIPLCFLSLSFCISSIRLACLTIANIPP